MDTVFFGGGGDVITYFRLKNEPDNIKFIWNNLSTHSHLHVSKGCNLTNSLQKYNKYTLKRKMTIS